MSWRRLISVMKTTANNRIGSRTAPSLTRATTEINTCRYMATEGTKYTKVTLKHEKSKLRTYLAQRYMKYLGGYTKVIENKFPTAIKMYKVFSFGIKDFYKDFKDYISLSFKFNRDRGFKNFTRQEIELYQKMPSDVWRITPVLILSAIPFGNYLVFPLAFMRPRSLLCSHFWSIQQRAEFSVLELKERLKHNRPVFRALQQKLDKIENRALKEKWTKVIAMMGSGVHPTPRDIIECKELFKQAPYHLNSISYAHSGHLLKIHSLRKSLFRRSKLKYRAVILHEMDKAIIREGGLRKLSTESLRQACHLRGLNSTHLSNQDMIKWLQQWLQISQIVDRDSYSLLLHCPIFFAYNHPQNWMLIY